MSLNASSSPSLVRQQIRSGQWIKNTSGLSAGFVQGNIVILPKAWADDFLKFATLNPQACPIVGMSENPGDFLLPSLGKNVDIRSNLSSYKIFCDGECTQEVADISDYWQDDLVTFVLGCSFSFEEALIAEGLEVRNITENVNVPMYRTNIDCQAAGPFYGKTVVSMRPMVAKDAIRAIQICSHFPAVHGAPLHFGSPEMIGISDINKPDFGEAVTIKEGEVPVFWACGVTPQVALEQAKLPFCITHSPGCMLVTDILNSDLSTL